MTANAFKIDFHDPAAVVRWHRTPDGLRRERDPDYRQTCYVAGPAAARAAVEAWVSGQSGVTETKAVRKYTSLRAVERTPLLRIDCRHTIGPRSLARRIRQEVELERWGPGTLRFYNVDLAPQFRYCLETGTDPTVEDELATLQVTLSELSIADRKLAEATVADEPIDGDEWAVLEAIATALDTDDPDVLIVNDAEVIPLLSERALALDFELQLGREPGWTRLAGTNTVESYGLVRHSAARYDVPGRVVLNTANSFLWVESSMAGLRYLVKRSHKPLQETAWGSIGNILTSMQIREATERDVVIPWNKWKPETWKDVETLHTVDRGGFIMDPAVGLHENVIELDFSSLYPYIMCEYNISPDTILCDCHPNRTVLPGIEYNVCAERGFIADVLGPLLARREAAKGRIRETDSDETRRDERAISGAIKWILVSCFGYQGYRNSKFGRIECHEAINAVARDIFLRAKETLEDGGWRVVHGIVDSIWVTPVVSDPVPIEVLTRTVSNDVGIELEREAVHDWVAFVPRRGTDRGALTRYIAKKTDGGFKLRGIEARQRSTPPFVADAQQDLLKTLDETRRPERVLARLERHVGALRDEAVDPATLSITIRISQPLEAYSQESRTVGALRRAERRGLSVAPGESVRFVVIDDGATRADERVRLTVEDPDTYDAAFYEDQLVRATESVLSPLGWDRARIDRHRRETVDASLDAFAGK